MARANSRLLDTDELTRQLVDLPGVVRDGWGRLAVAVRAPSFPDAVRLVTLVAEDAEQLDHHPDVDLRHRTVVFTLSTHSSGGVTQLDVELAHRILEASKTVGATTQPPPQRLEIGLDCIDVAAVRAFWTAALGYRDQANGGFGGVELHDPSGRGPILWFQQMDPPRTGRGRFHLDVYVADGAAADARITACLAAGGRVVSDQQAPAWWVLSDPEGNEVCICNENPQGGGS